MEIIELLNNAIEYIENNLDATLEIDDIAKTAFLSRYHFQRMFHVVTGFTLMTYIRNRRLTLAAEEIAATDSRIIDIAFKYGYENPDAFTKAFQRLHGMTPSAVKKSNARLKAFPKLSFQIAVKGQSEIIYRIVEKEKFKILGKDFLTTTVEDACYKQIPEFCDKIWEEGTHHRINQILGHPKMHLLHGVCYDFKENGNLRYMMGGELSEGNSPHEFKTLNIPGCTWAVFEDSGRMPEKLVVQDIWRRIYSEWFPSSGFEQVEGPCVEKYFWKNDQHIDYTCEVWIPVKRK